MHCTRATLHVVRVEPSLTTYVLAAAQMLDVTLAVAAPPRATYRRAPRTGAPRPVQARRAGWGRARYRSPEGK